MKLNAIRAAAFASTALLAAQPAHSQETASVDAVASLEVADTSLIVSGVSDMQFDLVTIPNNSRGISNVVCSDDIGISGAFKLVNRTIMESPGFDGSPIAGFSSLSGCEFRNIPQVDVARFEIDCAPDVLTITRIVWNASTADPAINFLPPRTQVQFFSSSRPEALAHVGLDSNNSEGAVVCPADGKIEVLAGATLQVSQSAIAATNSSVGSVSLSVNY